MLDELDPCPDVAKKTSSHSGSFSSLASCRVCGFSLVIVAVIGVNS